MQEFAYFKIKQPIIGAIIYNKYVPVYAINPRIASFTGYSLINLDITEKNSNIIKYLNQLSSFLLLVLFTIAKVAIISIKLYISEDNTLKIFISPPNLHL